jgi:hypothetical protein
MVFQKVTFYLSYLIAQEIENFDPCDLRSAVFCYFCLSIIIIEKIYIFYFPNELSVLKKNGNS